MSEGHEEKPTQRSVLEILAERASNAKLNTLVFPPPELGAKGFVIQKDLKETPLTVANKTFEKGSLVAILRQNPNTQQYTLEFRIYESVRGFREQETQDVAFLLRGLVGERERLYTQGGLYARATRESQRQILQLTLRAITAKQTP